MTDAARNNFNDFLEEWDQYPTLIQMAVLYDMWHNIESSQREPIITNDGIDRLNNIAEDTHFSILKEEAILYGRPLPDFLLTQILAALTYEDVAGYAEMSFKTFKENLASGTENSEGRRDTKSDLLNLLLNKGLALRDAFIKAGDDYKFAGETNLREANTPAEILRRDKLGLIRYQPDNRDDPKADDIILEHMYTAHITMFSSHVLQNYLPQIQSRCDYFIDAIIRSLPRRTLTFLLENALITDDMPLAIRTAKVLVHLTSLSSEFNTLTPTDSSNRAFLDTESNTLTIIPDPDDPIQRIASNLNRILEASKEQMRLLARAKEHITEQLTAVKKYTASFGLDGDAAPSKIIKNLSESLEHIQAMEQATMLPPDYLRPYLTNTLPDLAQQLDIERHYRERHSRGF